MFYKCEKFQPFELVDRTTYDKWRGNVWFLFRPEALQSLDGIRIYFGKPVIVNDWYWNGNFQYRGFRPYHILVGSEYSQHRLGNGFDCDVGGMPAEEVRQEILRNKDHHFFSKITCLETGIAWVHFDCRNIVNRIQLVSP